MRLPSLIRPQPFCDPHCRLVAVVDDVVGVDTHVGFDDFEDVGGECGNGSDGAGDDATAGRKGLTFLYK